jgi:serine/threonine protein kinase
MEFADSGDLYQRIVEFQRKGCYMSEKFIWATLIQITQGLAVLHELKILHRDLKSANVFLNRDGTAKLGDMNVSKVAKAGMLYTQTGTPYYASPEVWNDEPYDFKSDIWSLGCVIYEMAALKPPFRAEDMQGLFRRVMSGEYPRLPRSFSADLSMLIDMLLQRSPSDRPSASKAYAEQILALPSVVRRMSALTVNRSSESSLLSTIVFPKNINLLSERLPVPVYHEEARSNSTEPHGHGGLPRLAKRDQSSRVLPGYRSSLTPSPAKIGGLARERGDYSLHSYKKILRENYGALRMPKSKYPRAELTRSKQRPSPEFSYLRGNPRLARLKAKSPVNMSTVQRRATDLLA